MLELSDRHPEWSFVFVGPKAGHREIDAVLKQMDDRPNVYFSGRKADQAPRGISAALRRLHHALRTDGYTRYIYPLKMHEYFASGKPTVSSPIRSVQEFGNVIALAGRSGQWSQAIEDSLSADQNSPGTRHYAKKLLVSTMERMVDKVAHTIVRRLGIMSGFLEFGIGS